MVSKELVIESQKQEITPSPTSLDIFGFCGNNRVKEDAAWFDASKRELMAMDHAWYTTISNKLEISDKLHKHASELNGQSKILTSTITCGLAFLRISEALHRKGLRENEVMDVFEACLNVNSAYCGMAFKNTGDNSTTNIFSPLGELARKRIQRTALDQELRRSKVPEWFKGPQREWVKLIELGSNFSVLFSDADFVDGKRMCVTFRGMYPDWYLDYKNHGKMPTKEEVKLEAEEDVEEWEGIRKQVLKVSERLDYIEKDRAKKFENVRNWDSSRTSALAERVRDFGTYIFYIDAFTAFNLNRKTLGEKVNQSHKSVNVIKSTDFEENVLRHFSKTQEVKYSTESFALFIERCLIDSGVINSCRDAVNDENVAAIRLLLETRPVIEEPQREKWNEIKQNGKRNYNILFYHLRPMVGAIADEDALGILEDLNSFEDKTIEEIVWKIATAMHKVSRNQPHSQDKEWLSDLWKSVHRLEEFNLRWMRANWRWAYRQLVSKIVTPYTDIIKPTEEIISAETQEMIEELISSEKSALDDWKVLYLANLNDPSNEKHHHEFSGKSAEELEDELARYVFENKISLSIKSRSVIRALEGIVTAPSYVENTRMAQVVNGERFKKLKRKNMRIFYRIDPQSKMILFHLYHKEDMSYRKLNK